MVLVVLEEEGAVFSAGLKGGRIMGLAAVFTGAGAFTDIFSLSTWPKKKEWFELQTSDQLFEVFIYNLSNQNLRIGALASLPWASSVVEARP